MDFFKSFGMKTFLLLLFSLSVACHLDAQTFAEWFQQKKTQKKYLLQQIAALQLYIECAQKGYKIAQGGLSAISDFSKGNFDLHSEYFNSLQTVNPQIRKYAKVAELMALQINIIRNYKSTYRKIKSSNAFSKDELNYVGKVFTNLLDDCGKTLEQLITVMTDGKLQMKEDERMARIDKLCLEMQERYDFSNSFGNEAVLLAASRIKEQTVIQASRRLQGIKNE